MTVYFSATAAARHDQHIRTRFADGLHHRGLAAVQAQLARPATAEPPTFREVAARDGWCETADRVNRWCCACAPPSTPSGPNAPSPSQGRADTRA